MLLQVLFLHRPLPVHQIHQKVVIALMRMKMITIMVDIEGRGEAMAAALTVVNISVICLSCRFSSS